MLNASVQKSAGAFAFNLTFGVRSDIINEDEAVCGNTFTRSRQVQSNKDHKVIPLPSGEGKRN